LTGAPSLLFPEQADLASRLRIVWFSGVGLTVLAIAAVGLVAQRDGSPTHVANLLTGAFLANHFAMNRHAFYAIGLPEYVVALVLGFGIAVGFWLWRRKRTLAPADK
jgi:hypothetical protein